MTIKASRFTPEALLEAPRRSAGVPNPSATLVLFTVSTYSFKTHSKTNELRLLDVSSGQSYELIKDDDISDPTWLNDDEFVYLHSEGSNTNLYWSSTKRHSSHAESGSKRYNVGTIEAPAGNLKLAKLSTSKYAVVLSAKASPDGSIFNPDKATEHRSTGKLYDSLYVRHWDQWIHKERNSLWYGTLAKDGDGRYQLSSLTNALEKTFLESPIAPFGGGDNFDVSSKGIIFVSKDPKVNPALNTKCTVYLIHIDDWEGDSTPKPEEIALSGYDGAKSSPVFSPDGRKAAFLAMKQNGYESDKNRIFVVSEVKVTASEADLTLSSGGGDTFWDRSPQSVAFSGDGTSILAVAEDMGYGKLFSIPLDNPSHARAQVLTSEGSVSDIRPVENNRVFVSRSSLIDNSLFSLFDLSGLSSHQSETTKFQLWSNTNSGGGTKFGLNAKQVSSIWTPASNPKVNKQVHSWVIKPSNFDKSKKYPVAYLIHGGPQGSWGDNWSTRWNPAVFAEQGYIVIAPNPTGSTGYGQGFTDAIRNNWGGDPYEDIVKAFDWVGQNLLEADNDRAVALGASYGGYMMNWIQGHDLGRKFKALVCHDGIFSCSNMLSTDELYFPFCDLGGTPFYNPNSTKPAAAETHRNFGTTTYNNWRKWDPSEHLANWATPELIIHSTKDYRIALSEGLAAFNVLQARGVDSQLLTFPDENHWVLKPENSLVWHKVVLNFINKYVGLPPYTPQTVDSPEFWGGFKEDREEAEIMPAQGKPET